MLSHHPLKNYKETHGCSPSTPPSPRKTLLDPPLSKNGKAINHKCVLPNNKLNTEMTTFINNYSILPRLSGLSKLKFMNFWSNDFNGPSIIQPILSAFYNILQRNFGILLIL
jgi:hypothetical protein